MDNQGIDWLREGNIDAILDTVTHESVVESGNATQGFLNYILMLGVAGPEAPNFVDNLDLFHTMETYFTWYPK